MPEIDQFGGVAVDEPSVDEFGGQLVQEPPRMARMLPEVSARPEEAGARIMGMGEPLVSLPRLEGSDPRLQAFVSGLTGQPPSLPASETVAAAANVAKGLPEFLTSPLGIATAPVAGAGGIPARLLGLGFAGQMARDIPAAAREAGRVSVEGTPQEQKEALLGLGSQIALPATLATPALAEAARLARRIPPRFPLRPTELPPERPMAGPQPVKLGRVAPKPAPTPELGQEPETAPPSTAPQVEPSPPAAPEAPTAAPLNDLAKQSGSEFFESATKMREQGGPQIVAERLAQQIPDRALWERLAAEATKEGERIGKEIREKPETFQARSQEWAGAAQKAQFFNEGLKIIRGEKEPEPSAKTVSEAPAPAPVYSGVDATVIAGKPLGDWFKVTKTADLPKGQKARIDFARQIGAKSTKPTDILGALKQDQARIRVRIQEQTAPPLKPEEALPLTPQAAAAPTATETTPPVPAAEMPKTPTATGMRPAIRLVGGRVVVGDAGTTHPDIIKANSIKAEEIDQRGFVDEQGKFHDREQTAAITGQPTEREPGRQHSTDLPEAKPTAPAAAEPTIQQAQAAIDAIKAKMDANAAERDRLFKLRNTLPPSQQRQNDLDINALVREYNNLETEFNKAEMALKTAHGQAGIERMRTEALPFRGIREVPSEPKITSRVLKAQRENLITQLDRAIKEAPEEGSDKIQISVPGDGDFSLFNNRRTLEGFRATVEKQFPATVEQVKAKIGGTKASTTKSGKPTNLPKVTEPNAADLPEIAGGFVSGDKSRFSIQTAYSDGTQIVATDGRQLIRIVTGDAPGTPAKPVRVTAEGNIDAEAAAESSYPNYNQVRPQDPALVKGAANTDQLWKLARQAQAFKNTYGDKAVDAVHLFLNTDGTFGGRNTQLNGESFEHNILPGAVDLGGINADYLVDAMNAARKLGNDKIDLYAESTTGPFVIVGKNHEHVIMPMRTGEGIDVRLDPTKIPASVVGRKLYVRPPEGLGPLTHPESHNSRVVQPQGGKYSVTYQGGTFQVSKHFPKTGAYGTERWDEIASLERVGEKPPTSAALRQALTKGLEREPTKDEVSKIAGAMNELLADRRKLIREGEERLKATKPPKGPGPIGMGGAATGEIQATGPRGEPTHGIAARVLEQRRQQGVIAPVEPGEGISPEESIERGRQLLAQGVDPEGVLEDFDRTKAVSADGIAVVRAQGERLARTAYAMADAHGIHSPEYEAAWEADSEWAKRTKPMQTEWHKIGQAQQGETEIDTGTFHGLRKAFFESTGKDFTPKQAKEAEGIAKGVKEATEAADKAKHDVFAEVGKQAKATPEKKPKAPKPGEIATPDAITLWKRSKAMIDAGENDFDALRHKLAQEFGIPVDEVTRKLAEPKSARTLTDDMYRKMAEQRRMVNQAKQWLKNEQVPGWLQFARKVPRVFFTAKILGHGTVGMITHAGLNIFNPIAWRTYWPNFFRQYRLILDKPYHERMMQDLLRDPLFTKARRAGLANDPFRYQDDYQTPTLVKWLDRIGLTGNRGFDALKLFRQARFNQIWNATPDTVQTPAYAKMVAASVNWATGAVRQPFREWANWTFFAPRLEASRWAWAVKGPWDAAKTFVDWNKATPEEKAFAMSQLKEKAAIAGTYYSLLMLNQGLLSASGSDQRINFTNPRRGDFLAFKAAGHNIGIVGPMLGMVRLFANLYHAAAGKRGKVESLTPRASEFGQIGLEYARGKLSPFAGFGVDVVSQADFQGRPMPYSTDAVPKYLRRQGLGRYTYGEYAAQEFTPIPVSEAVREVWHDQGMGDDEIDALLKALLVGVAAGSTGARVSAESPPSPQ